MAIMKKPAPTKPAPKKPALKPITTMPVKPKAPAMPTKRPAVGADKSARKRYGSASYNNGYTN